MIRKKFFHLRHDASIKNSETSLLQESRFYLGTNPHIIALSQEKDHILAWISLDRAERELYPCNQREIISKIKQSATEDKRVFK